MKKSLNTNSSILRNCNMKTLYKYLFIAMLAFTFASCDDDDEAIEVKDYNVKTFSADYNYTDESYMDQVYFSFTTEDSLVATYTNGTTGWTDFNIYSGSDSYNITTDVEGWDLVFTNYTANLGTTDSPYEHAVTGVLINTSENIEVASMEYTDSENSDTISTAFVALSLSDVSSLEYSADIDAIGYGWKTHDHSTHKYTVNPNYFYIVKLDSETYYKLRFISFYGSSTSERIATIQYQLMQ